MGWVNRTTSALFSGLGPSIETYLQPFQLKQTLHLPISSFVPMLQNGITQNSSTPRRSPQKGRSPCRLHKVKLLCSAGQIATQTLAILTPPRVILQSTKRTVPTAQLTPAKIVVYRNEPLSRDMSWPPIGEPVNAASDANAKTVPVKVPISLAGAMCAQSTGVRPMPAPEPMPKSAAKRIMAAFPVASSHSTRTRIVVKKLIPTITLKGPTLSATALGMVRPITLVHN